MHAACSVIHFLLAQLAGYQHGANSCGFSEVSPLHHRTCKCSGGVSSLYRPLCHPDIHANGMTGQQLVPIGSVCVDYLLTGICEHFPLHPSTSRDNELSRGLGLSPQYTQRKREGPQRELLLSPEACNWTASFSKCEQGH